MGVHGLTSYVEKDRRFLVNVRLQDTRLVIDGSSLYYSLYFGCGADQQCGGEYEAFAEQVRHFFAALFTCRIQPFVVLDGGMDHSDKKFATFRQRAKRSINDANSLSRGTNGSVLPLLTKAVFMQLLSDLAVPFFQCAAEADMEIATLASQWGCPVLTNDSDFYIFELRAGYIPFRHFQWASVAVGRQAHPSQCSVSARCYTVQRLCSHFRGLTPQMLPLFAVIMGNDYTPAHIKQLFFSRVELPVVAAGRRGNPQVEGLLLWLSQFSSPAEALEEVLELDAGGREQRRGATQSVFSAGMQDYTLPPRSSLAQFFSGGLNPLPGSMEVPEILAAQPQWLLRGIVTGRLPSLVQDVLVLQRVMLIAQVENCRLPSSHCTSLAIRQVIYGLLLLGRQQAPAHAPAGRGRGRGRGGRGSRGTRGCRHGGQSEAEGCVHIAPTVVEYDRCDLNLTKSTVDPVQLSGAPHVQIEMMDQTSVSARVQVLLRVLHIEERALGTVPPTLRLPMCVTSFWLQRSRPRPDPTILQAVILGLTFGELSYRRTITGDPMCSRPGVAAVLHRLHQLRVQRKERRGLNLEVAHALSQWQSCMWAALCLNQLLCCPLPDPPCAWLFSGTLLHAVQAALRQGASVEDFLAGDPFPGQLFSSLMEATLQPCGPGPTGHLGPSSSGARKRGRGQRKHPPQGRGQAPRGRVQRVDERGLNNRFAMLMSDEDYDEEESTTWPYGLLSTRWCFSDVMGPRGCSCQNLPIFVLVYKLMILIFLAASCAFHLLLPHSCFLVYIVLAGSQWEGIPFS
ncbi:protein asteroid homolog 1 isoform X1 [Alosa sapidissima]|uniref:protein asteroid homolog 1 isoform X1 n=2 Tax=Alosa sapidissima TaxID=34773 RepID=UPI001C09577E|nr:protein asteroid homolog 1 isoform X1 [Alosa sapidissima]XP_041931899.1 protein asteroid homolog 1 isoform X1 [Alosa sapidissima]